METFLFQNDNDVGDGNTQKTLHLEHLSCFVMFYDDKNQVQSHLQNMKHQKKRWVNPLYKTGRKYRNFFFVDRLTFDRFHQTSKNRMSHPYIWVFTFH